MICILGILELTGTYPYARCQMKDVFKTLFFSGLRYDGPPVSQRPKGTIHRITSTNPISDDSPFYDPTGAPMKPAARLHLIKQREYFKQCPDGMPRPGGNHAGMLNPSWNSPDAQQQTSYYYGNGIGAPTPEEIYGNIKKLGKNNFYSM